MPGTHVVPASPRSPPRRAAHKAAVAGRVPRAPPREPVRHVRRSAPRGDRTEPGSGPRQPRGPGARPVPPQQPRANKGARRQVEVSAWGCIPRGKPRRRAPAAPPSRTAAMDSLPPPRPVGRYAPRPGGPAHGTSALSSPLNSQGKWFSPRRFRVGPGGRAGGGDCGAGGGGGGEGEEEEEGDDSPPALCGAGADYRAAVRSAEAPARPRCWVMARCRCRRLHKGGARCRGGKHRAEHAAGRGGARQARPAATSRGAESRYVCGGGSGARPGASCCRRSAPQPRTLLHCLSASSPRQALESCSLALPRVGLGKQRGLQLVHIQPRGEKKKKVIKRKGGSGMSSVAGLGPGAAGAEGGGRLRAPQRRQSRGCTAQSIHPRTRGELFKHDFLIFSIQPIFSLMNPPPIKKKKTKHVFSPFPAHVNVTYLVIYSSHGNFN